MKKLKRALADSNHQRALLASDLAAQKKKMEEQMNSTSGTEEQVERLKKMLAECAAFDTPDAQIAALCEARTEIESLKEQLAARVTDQEKKENEYELAMEISRREKQQTYAELLETKKELQEFIEKIQTSEGLADRWKEARERVKQLEKDWEQEVREHDERTNESERKIFYLEERHRKDQRDLSRLEKECYELRQECTAMSKRLSAAPSVNGDIPLDMLFQTLAGGVPSSEDRLPPLGYRPSSPGHSGSEGRYRRSPSPGSWSAASSGSRRRSGRYRYYRDDDMHSRGSRGGGSRRSYSPTGPRPRSPSPRG